jgi:hypothetical protein
MFHRLLAGITYCSDRYIDYFNYEFPIRPITEGGRHESDLIWGLRLPSKPARLQAIVERPLSNTQTTTIDCGDSGSGVGDRLARSTFDLFGIVKRIVDASRNSGHWRNRRPTPAPAPGV